MAVIIAEKYRTAKILAKVLGYDFKFPFFLKQDDAGGCDVIAYAQGHLFEISPPDNDHYRWENPTAFNHFPTEFSFIPKHKTDDEYVLVGKKRKLPLCELRERLVALLKEHEVIINACDSERSGEQIFYDLFNYSGVTNKKLYRLNLRNGITQSLILAGMQNLKPALLLKPSYYAAQALSVSDFGYALLTRVMTYYGRKNLLHELLGGYTDKIQSVVSLGRVQTALLQLIYEQCIAVEKVKLRSYFAPQVIVNRSGRNYQFDYDFEALGYDPSMLVSQAVSEAFIAKAKVSRFIITSVEERHVVTQPPELFDTAGVQAAVNEMTPEQTMNVLQELYMKGLITYPRTDCNDLPEDELSSGQVNHRLEALCNNLQSMDSLPKSVKSAEALPSQLQDSGTLPSCVKDIDSAHTAIIPTGGQKDLSGLSEQEQLVYGKICERFVDALTPSQVMTEVVVMAEFEGVSGLLGEPQSQFRMTKALPVADSKKSSHSLFSWEVGDVLECRSIECVKHKIDVPKYYSVSELPLIMKDVKHRDAAPEVKDLLSQSNGLGTGATRHTFLTKLLKRNYVEVVKLKDDSPRVIITSKGIALLESVPNFLKSPTQTALWEYHLLRIERCEDMREAKRLRNDFIRQVFNQLETFVRHLNTNKKQFTSQQSSRTQFSKQQRRVLSRTGLSTNKATLRDARSVSIRERNLSEGNIDHLPSQEQLDEALRLAKTTRLKMTTKELNNALECEKYINKAKQKLAPTDVDRRRLQKLATILRVPISPKSLPTRQAIRKKIRELEKAAKSKGISIS